MLEDKRIRDRIAFEVGIFFWTGTGPDGAGDRPVPTLLIDGGEGDPPLAPHPGKVITSAIPSRGPDEVVLPSLDFLWRGRHERVRKPRRHSSHGRLHLLNPLTLPQS